MIKNILPSYFITSVKSLCFFSVITKLSSIASRFGDAISGSVLLGLILPLSRSFCFSRSLIFVHFTLEFLLTLKYFVRCMS